MIVRSQKKFASQVGPVPGLDRKVRKNSLSPFWLTLSVELNSGTVSEGVAHFSCQSVSGVTNNIALKPETDSRDLVCSTGAPLASRQALCEAAGTEPLAAASRNAVKRKFIGLARELRGRAAGCMFEIRPHPRSP